MRAGLTQKEPNLLKSWEELGIYYLIRRKSEGNKKFILHDGPPYANGNIHIGHALNKILKDMVVKFKAMQGYDSEYVPGWDCHGLPIEHQLFKELKSRKADVECVTFRRKAYDYAMKYVGIQKEQFKRLGVFGDWDHPYLTLTPEYEYWILKALAILTKKGYIYRGLKPVNWCYQCETALAEAEVEYEDHTSPSIYVKFKVNNPQVLGDLPEQKPVYLLIWTTTPWTLLANVAVSVHQNFQYSLVEMENEIFVVESSLISSVFEKIQASHYQPIKEVDAQKMKALFYEHPFNIKMSCRVVLVDYVTKEEGTGLVHTAPGHGQEDYETGLVNDLEIIMPVNHRGIFTDEAGQFSGQHVFKANEKIIEDFQSRGLLFYREDYPHSYPHCWRCKKPIVFRATEQWFLKIDHQNLRGRLKEAIQKVEWIPSSGQERISGMITTRPDWCLSRQRYWGVPIPAISCMGCEGQYLLASEIIEHFAEVVKKQGSNVWFEKDIKDLLPEDFVCPNCGQSDFKKTYDILDVWFDSGVSYFAVVKEMMRKELPADLYLEGSDQHRGWFQSSLIPSMAIDNKPPYEQVLTHGFVVDGEGRKMSKSLGNVISPQDIIKDYGADILRLWVASSNYNEDVRISREILGRLVDAYRKVRNTVRFLLGNLDGFIPEKDSLPYEELLDIDQWALYQLTSILEIVTDAYHRYDFSKVYRTIYFYCNENLSGVYLDILKDRLYTSQAQSPERRSAQTVLFHILNSLVRVMAPIFSFTAEEIFDIMPRFSDVERLKSVHLLPWPSIRAEWRSKESFEKFKLLMLLRPFVLKGLEDKRRFNEIGSSLEAKVIFWTASKRDFKYLNDLKEILPSIFIVSQVEIKQVDSVTSGTSQDFPETEIKIVRADGQKCVRCWNYKMDVGKISEHNLLCSRCAKVVQQLTKFERD